MFGHNQPFDLQRMPWGRKMSMFIVYEDFYNHDLYLSHVRTGILQSERKNLFRMQPVTGGEILSIPTLPMKSICVWTPAKVL